MKLIEIAVRGLIVAGWIVAALIALATISGIVWWLAMRPRWRNDEARELARLMRRQR